MSDNGSSDWEEIVGRATDDPGPRVPPKDERGGAFKLVAELILHYADATDIVPAWATAYRARGEHGKAAREAIAERVRRRWGNDSKQVSDFFSDCRLLARIPWSYDPSKLKEADTKIDAVRKSLEMAKQRATSRYAREAIDRAIS